MSKLEHLQTTNQKFQQGEHACNQHFLLLPQGFNSLPNAEIMEWSKLKAFAEIKINVTEKLIFVFEKLENIMGKGENAGYQHFLLFPQCFQKTSYTGSLIVGIVW